MPRKGRGGARQGTSGTAYSNRTDLNSPISTVPNQEYGMATAQREAQRAVPMGESPVSAPTPTPTVASSMRDPNRNATPAPGTLPLFQATNRPQEPVTAGIPVGPGAGPEAMQRPFTPARPISDAFAGMAPESAPMSSIIQAAALLGL